MARVVLVFPGGPVKRVRIIVAGPKHGNTKAGPKRRFLAVFLGVFGLLDVFQNTVEFVEAIVADDRPTKAKKISKAVGIISELSNTLDYEIGGIIAENLDALYDYMNRRLLEANVNNNIEYLDEVHGLMSEIKIGWDGIAAEANKS